MSDRPARLIAGFATVGGWTMGSRVLGFLRDMAIAASLGAGPVAEAFFVAFTLPNMFRRLFAEGAFNTAFVPLYAKRLEGEGEGAARAFASEAFAGLLAVLLALTLVASLAMPALVLLLASGFAGDARLGLATDFGRILFGYVVFISLAALVSGALNAHGRFAAAAAAPVLLNVILIAALALAEAAGLGRGAGEGYALSAAVMVAGIAQLALVWWAARRIGAAPRLVRPRLTPGLRRLAVVAAPAALAAGVLQVNLVVGRQVASHFEGAVVWLWMADRVFQLPLGVVGVAIGVVLLPELARRVRAGDPAGSRAAVNRAAEIALGLTLPATAALLAMPGLVVAVLFERGAYGPGDTAATALALAAYALGLPAYVLQKVVQPVYFAREDTATPLRHAVWAMLANAVAAVALAPVLGFVAAPAAASLAAWVNLALLWRGARAHGADLAPDARLRHRLPRIFAASLAMGAAVGLLAAPAEALAPLARAAALAALVAGGLIGYLGLTTATGALVPREIRGAFRRRESG